MQGSPIVLAIAAAFGGMTALMAIGAVVTGSPVALLVAIPLAVTAYFMYYHASGKLLRQLARREARVRQRRRRGEPAGSSRRRGGFGAGPRRRGGPRTRAEREARFGRTQDPFQGSGSRDPRDRAPSSASGPTPAEARDILGIDGPADEASIKAAYRERVKATHPDRGGDEAEFKRVTAAYDRLSD